MATTSKGIYYPDNYSEVADIPADMKEMAESVDEAIGNSEAGTSSQISALRTRMTNVENKNTQQDTDIGTNASNIGTLQNRVSSVESKNVQQDNDIRTLQNRVSSVESKNSQQDSKISAIETKNTQQDNKISALETDNTTNKTDIATIKQEQTTQNTNIQTNATNIEGLIEDLETAEGTIAEHTQAIADLEAGQATQDSTIEALQTECERLRDDLANTTASVPGEGENITLNNTANARFKKFSIGGNSKQGTTEGRNLLKTSLEIMKTLNTQGTWNNNIYTFHGLTFEVNEDLSIIVDGTSNADTNFYLARNNSNPFELSSGTYYLTSHEITGASNTWKTQFYIGGTNYNIYGNGSDKEATVTLTEDALNNGAILIIYSGQTLSKVKFCPMVATTSNAEYEKYTYGASPNPSYEQPIKSAGDDGSITEKIVNKNLLKITENNRLVHCSYVSGANSNEYKLLCTASDMYVNVTKAKGNDYNKINDGELIPCDYGETIYFDVGNSLFTKNYFTEFDSNHVSLGFYSKNTSSGTYTPTNQNCKYVILRFGIGVNAVVGTTYTLAPIICKTADTSYVPHAEQIYTIPTQQPTHSAGEVRDGFVKVNGKWYERHKIGKLVLDGTESGWYYTNNVFYIQNYFDILTSYSGMSVISNKFKGSINADNSTKAYNNGNNTICGTSNPGRRVYIRYDDITSLNDFKTWLTTHNTEVIYILAEPTDLPCTAEQEAILNQIEQEAKTYEGTTHIFSEDEVPAYVEAKAYKDVATTLNNLETRLQVLESEV